MADLTTKLANLLGEKSAKALNKSFAMVTAEDLVRHYPRRYAEYGKLTDLAKLVPGEHVTIMARIRSVKNYSFGPGGKKTRTEVTVSDGTGTLKLAFFNQAWRFRSVPHEALAMFAGQVTEFRGERQLTHPDLEFIPEEGPDATSRFTGAPIPMYPASAAVASWKIADCMALVLDALDACPDPIPSDLLESRGLWNLKGSLEAIHRPRNADDWQRARDRFRYEEAFVIQTILAQRRLAFEADAATARPLRAGGLREAFERQLPFELTAGQREVLAQLTSDLARDHPMHRLLQGEVGSGKTIVALMAMLQTVDAGGQAALLAPTEVLAQQHYRSFLSVLGDLAKGGMLGSAEGATRVRLLTGSMTAAQRKQSLLDLASGEAGLVVGTHALIQDVVQFADLGLVVVDEQHRFGVEQRAALNLKSQAKPHILAMTATPIPRTIAMTTFGDLETSTLAELPAGRQPIQTTIVPTLLKPAWLARTWERIREEVAKGRQAYIVGSRIGDGESSTESTTHAVTDLYEQLSQGPLAGLRLAMLHGRMPADEKDAAMSAFAAHEVDVLVATTVVEVGVDVPNATVMAVIDADRFGVSQLHQLRGRVGRGSEPGLCLLVTDIEQESVAWQRLEAVASTNDGFELSRFDIELRREGDVLGARQSGGRNSLRLLSVVKHESIIAEARDEAMEVVRADPTLATHPALAAAVRAVEEADQAEFLEKS
ncbi:MAG: ATP-dependent helicase RecG [Nocardioidaceae bacterium]|nr:ATP-dependent helicase RecG [Nocardioidaceae bacterium]